MLGTGNTGIWGLERHDPSRPALKRATINDVATLAGVSKKTVSRVINKVPSVKANTREAVASAIRELGFTPNPQARSLAFQRSFLVGLIYDNPSPTYVVSMQEGVLDVLRPAGLELIVHPCDHRAPDILEELRDFVDGQRLAGLILPPPMSEDERIFEMLRGIGCAYVRIAAVPLDETEAMVATNDQLGAAEAAHRLADLGHRRIALIRGPASFGSSRVRGDGFLRALAERGLAVDPAQDLEGGYTFESGLEAGHRLLSAPQPPSAVFALNDDMAMGVMQAARERGLELPRDLSIIGYDDLPMAARVWPNLTSVRLPVGDMGRLAAHKLLAAIGAGTSGGDDAEIRPTLVVRHSDVPSGL